MVATAYANRVLVDTATVGTGTLTLGAASAPNMLTAAEGGAVDGEIYTYLIEEGNDFELGTGIYTAAGTTLTRAVIKSKIGGVVGPGTMVLAGNARVRITESAQDIATALRNYGNVAVAGILTVGSGVKVTGSAGGGSIVANTPDGADDAYILIGGGGAIATSRGPYAQFYGNEHATLPGALYLSAGLTGLIHIQGVPVLDGGGMKWPGTPIPSSDPNTMDEYEEGTWTPFHAFGGNNVGATWSVQNGQYIKVGKLVVANGQMTWSAKGTSLGAPTFGGFPFQAASGINHGLASITALGGPFASLTAGVCGYMGAATTNMLLRAPHTTGSGAMTEANFAAAGSCYFGAAYQSVS